jgi:hypothetical protein
MNIIPTIQDVNNVPGSNNWATTTLAFLNSVGSFAVGASDTVSSSTVTAQAWANDDPDFPNNLQYVRVLQCPASGTSKAQAFTNFDTTSALTKEATAYRLLRVQAGANYVASMAVRRVVSTTGTPNIANTTVSLTSTWYDRDFNVLRTQVMITPTQPSAGLAWTYLSGGSTAPVGAVYMGYKVELLGDFKEVIHLGGIRFEQVQNARVNIMLNAEPLSSIANWNVNANQAATWPKIAGGSLQMKALAAGNMSVFNDFVPVINNRSYAVFAQVTTAASRTVNLSVTYYDVANVPIGTLAAATAVINGSGTLGGLVTAPYNAFAAAITVEVAGAAINETAQVFKALHEMTSIAPTLVNYFAGVTNGFYMGGTNGSTPSLSIAPNPYRDPRLINISFDPARSNLAPNPSFGFSSSSPANWGAAIVGSVISVSASAQAYSGPNAGSITNTTTACTQALPWEAYTFNYDGSLVPSFSPFTTSVYARLKSTSVQTGVTAKVITMWNDAFGTTTYTSGPWTAINNTGYTRLVATTQAGQNGTGVGLIVLVAGLPANNTDFLFGGAQIELGNVATPYFDASTNTDAVWQGGAANAHAAASHEYPERKTKYYLMTTILPDHVPPQTPYRVVLADDVDWINVRQRT